MPILKFRIKYFLRIVVGIIMLVFVTGCANGFSGWRNPSKPSVNAVKTTAFPYIGQPSTAAVVTQPASLASTVFRYVDGKAYFCTQAKPRVALDVFSAVTAAIAASYNKNGEATPKSIDLASSFQSILANSNLELSTPTSVAYLESSMASLCENLQGALSKLSEDSATELFGIILENSKEIAIQEMKVNEIKAERTIDIQINLGTEDETIVAKAQAALNLMKDGASLDDVVALIKAMKSSNKSDEQENKLEKCKSEPGAEGCIAVPDGEPTKVAPTAEQCKADPKLEGCIAIPDGVPTKVAPTAEQCKADPKLEGCAL